MRRLLPRLAAAPVALLTGGATAAWACDDAEEQRAAERAAAQLRRDGFVVLRAKGVLRAEQRSADGAGAAGALLAGARASVLARLADQQGTAAYALQRVVSVVNKPGARYEVLLPDEGAPAALLRGVLREHAAFYAAALSTEMAPGGRDAPPPSQLPSPPSLSLASSSSSSSSVSSATAAATAAVAAVSAEAALLVELGAIVSESGARRQDVHSDIPYAAGTRLFTTFVALQDVGEEMGPTLMYAGTHTGAFHAARPAPSLACRASRALPRAIDLLLPSWLDVDGGCDALFDDARPAPPARMTLRRGDAVVMDTRLHHCGGANRSAPGAPPRVLLQFSLLAPSAETGRAELGTAYTNVTDELFGDAGESLPTLGVLLRSSTQADYIGAAPPPQAAHAPPAQ